MKTKSSIGKLISGRYITRKYNIPGHGTVYRWLKWYQNEQTQVDLLPDMKPKEEKPEEIEPADNQNLEEALKLAKLKIASLEAMIDIAEQTFNLDIRKKSGTKQSFE